MQQVALRMEKVRIRMSGILLSGKKNGYKSEHTSGFSQGKNNVPTSTGVFCLLLVLSYMGVCFHAHFSFLQCKYTKFVM